MNTISRVIQKAYFSITQWQMIPLYYRILGRMKPLHITIPKGMERAVILSFDVETFPREGDSVTSVPNEYSEYLPSMIDMFRSHDIAAQFFMTGKTIEFFPGLAKELLRRGHSLGGHGYVHERMTQVGYAQQNRIISSFREACIRQLGLTPVSWRSPYALSNFDTYRALSSNGFTISSSTALTVFPVRIKNVLEVPYSAMDGDVLDYRNPSHWSKWIQLMKNVIERNVTTNIKMFGMHPAFNMKYDPKLEGMRCFLDWIDTQKENTWIGSLDKLVEESNSLKNNVLGSRNVRP